MTDAELANYLRENGYPEQVCRGGRAGLVNAWRNFVAEAEHGFRSGLEDYRNHLDLRGLIALCGLEGEVAAEDARFQALLTATDHRVWESSAGGGFWDFGYPGNAAGRLLADLRAEGLAD